MSYFRSKWSLNLLLPRKNLIRDPRGRVLSLFGGIFRSNSSPVALLHSHRHLLVRRFYGFGNVLLPLHFTVYKSNQFLFYRKIWCRCFSALTERLVILVIVQRLYLVLGWAGKSLGWGSCSCLIGLSSKYQQNSGAGPSGFTFEIRAFGLSRLWPESHYQGDF